MLDEQNINENVIISPDDEEDNFLDNDESEVQIFNEKEPESEGDEHERKHITRSFSEDVDPTALSLSMSISACDIITKVKTFTTKFKTQMIQFKQDKPTEWDLILKTMKDVYQKDPFQLSNTIELLAALTIEYEDALEKGLVQGTLSKVLLENKE